MASKTANTLKFHSYVFTPLKSGGQQWLVSSELAKAFQLPTTKSLISIYERHKGEFTKEMSYLLEKATRQSNGKIYRKKVRFFSLWGAHLLSVFVNTQASNEFRPWALMIITSTKEEFSNFSKRQFTDDELCSLCWLWKISKRLREGIELVYPTLRTLESPYAGSFYSMAYDYNHSLKNAKMLLCRETKHIAPHPYNSADSNWRHVIYDIRDD